MIATRIAAFIALLVIAAMCVGAAWFVYRTPGSVLGDSGPTIPAPARTSGSAVVTVREGESAKEIGDDLTKQGVVRSSRLFEALVGLTRSQNSLQAGEYDFDSGTPAVEVVRRIAEGRTASRHVTIPEGRRAEEIGALLEQAGIVKQQDFMAALVKSRYDLPFLQQVSADSLDGYLFPAGYEFSRNVAAQQVIQTMLRGFQDNVADKVQLEGQDMTLEQVVTLASIVEREAATSSERPIIASVFLNRLRDGIALEADPSVQYAVASDPTSVAQYGYWKRDLTLDDLKVESPYNTYVHPGLPPGPIANPGLASIEAVVRPASTNYLYFVAKNDGTHVFAETLEEHLRNVQQYQQ